MEKRIKRHYLESLARKYALSSKKVKGKILDEICTAEKCHRKHARLLKRGSTKRDFQSGKPRGRPSKYDNPDFCKVLRQLWKATQWMGSKALKASIPEWLPFYERHHGDVGEATRQQLTKISAATIDRILKPVKASGGKGRCGTKPGTLLLTPRHCRGTEGWSPELALSVPEMVVMHISGGHLRKTALSNFVGSDR